MENEVELLLQAAKKIGSNEKIRHRNYTMILSMFRHGLRVGEATTLRWTQIDFKNKLMHIIRLKNGKPSIHPIDQREFQALSRLKKLYPNSENVFSKSTNFSMNTRNIRHIVQTIGIASGLDIHVHPHMLRHACGFYLSNEKNADVRVIQDYIGHSDINNTVRYTALAPNRFKDLW